MIFVTGDTHGDLSKLKVSKLKKGDTLIICGDFGFVWDGSAEELKRLNWLSKRKYQILFVEGAHENFEMLSHYPQIEFCGGQARKIADNIYQLMRGEIFTIENEKIFAFGGGDDEERELSEIKESSDFQRLPTEKECEHARKLLKAAHNTVDYIVTYDVGFKLRSMLRMESNCFNNLHAYLNEVATTCQYKTWFFGCFHMDLKFSSVYHAVYKNIYEIKSGKEL